MAVLAIITGKMTKAQYDGLAAKLHHKDDHPAGGVLHSAAFDEAGNVHVADVWESPEALNAFVGSKLMPEMMALKIQPPQVAVYPLHKALVYPASAKYKA